MSPAAEQVLRLTPARLYFVRIAPDRIDYAVLLGLIVLIGLAAGLAHWASFDRSPLWRRVLTAPFAFLCVMGIAHLIHLHLSRYPPLWNVVARRWTGLGVPAIDGWFVVAAACGMAVVGAFGGWPRGWMLAKPILCGGAAVIWLATATAWLHPAGPLVDVPSSIAAKLAPAHDIGPGTPVVWLILDEWDYDLTFKRQDGKVFPEFERLRNQSVFLENVRAAGNITLVAVPALLMGRPLREYRGASAAGARFVSAGTTESFPGPRTIFDTAAQFGYRSHIVGWYHPYCRIFGAQTASCWWDDLMLPALRPGGSVPERAAAFLRESIELEVLPIAGPANNIVKQMARIKPMMEQASTAASHGGRSFSFLHLPVPHGPFFSLDSQGHMVPLNTDVRGYQSGLEAADRALGTLRQSLEQTGVWEQALVIVTSDHPYRYQYAGGYGNGHIPMMIKFPHQATAVVSSHPFQAVETKNLIEDFMQGTLATPERALAWLDRSGPAAGARTLAPQQPVAMTNWKVR